MTSRQELDRIILEISFALESYLDNNNNNNSNNNNNNNDLQMRLTEMEKKKELFPTVEEVVIIIVTVVIIDFVTFVVSIIDVTDVITVVGFVNYYKYFYNNNNCCCCCCCCSARRQVGFKEIGVRSCDGEKGIQEMPRATTTTGWDRGYKDTVVLVVVALAENVGGGSEAEAG